LTSDRRVGGACLAAVLAVLAVLGGDVTSTLPECAHRCQTLAAAAPTPQATPPAPVPAALTVTPTPGADNVDPMARVLITATTGTRTDVAMVNDAGKAVAGVMTPDNRAWKPTAPLGYGRT
jgi:hypothetical protein